MATRDQQARIDQVSWYHEFDFGGGLQARSRTPDIENHRSLWRFIEQNLEAVDFRGKTVLEIGSWDGYWSFYAERRGAKEVLASDDLTQNWADGQGILLARELLNSGIEVRQNLSVYELSSLGRTFDIILCLGVYYHLMDPLYGLAQMRHCCHSGSLLLLEGDLVREGMAPNEVRLNYESHLPAFLPAVPVFAKLLQAAYFTVSSQSFILPPPRMRKARWYRRARPIQEPYLNRAFTVCRPFEGTNDCHPYEPPFGLKAYDERFRSA